MTKLKENFKNLWSLKTKNASGFTLVELIVVVAILAILAGIAVPAYSGYVEKAEKAADEQLLATVNTAFASACAINGDDVNEVNGAYAGLTDEKEIDLSSVTPYQDAFRQFYAGNEESAFKTYAGIYFNLTEHKFMEGSAAYMNALNTILNTMGDEVSLVQASSFATMGATSLMGAVDDVTDFAQLLIAGQSGSIFGMVNTPDYYENLAQIMGFKTIEDFYAYMEDLSEEDYNKLMANSTVLSVANTVSSAEYASLKTELINTLSSAGGLANVVGTITNDENSSEESLAAAALIYGLYTAYDSEAAGDVIVTGNFSEILNSENSEGFIQYLSELNTEGSKANADMEGYFAALEIVNKAVSDDSEVANQVLTGGYNDEELVGIVGSVIGNK